MTTKKRTWALCTDYGPPELHSNDGLGLVFDKKTCVFQIFKIDGGTIVFSSVSVFECLSWQAPEQKEEAMKTDDAWIVMPAETLQHRNDPDANYLIVLEKTIGRFAWLLERQSDGKFKIVHEGEPEKMKNHLLGHLGHKARMAKLAERMKHFMQSEEWACMELAGWNECTWTTNFAAELTVGKFVYVMASVHDGCHEKVEVSTEGDEFDWSLVYVNVYEKATLEDGKQPDTLCDNVGMLMAMSYVQGHINKIVEVSNEA